MHISDWSSDVCSSDLKSQIASFSAPSLSTSTHSTTPSSAAEAPASLRSWSTFGGRYATSPRRLRSYARRTRGLPAPCSEERPVGKERVSTCSSRWSLYTLQQTYHRTHY